MNDNDLEIFLRQLKQAIDWTAHLANGFDPNNGNYGTVFRNTNPLINGKTAFNIDAGYTTWNIDDYDINNYITLLEYTIGERNKYSSEKKDNIILSGRILCFETFLSTLDGAAIFESDCFFDESDVPPIDTWFYLEKVLNSNQRPILFCWIPSEFENVVNAGIEVEIMDSYSWLDKKDPVFYRKIMDML